MEGFFHFLIVLALCITGLITVTMVLFVVVMRMPGSNPLKDVLTSLLWRVSATAGLAVVAVPMQPIPGVDAAYDLGSAIFLIVYWIGFLRDIARAFKRPRVIEPEMRIVSPVRQDETQRQLR